MKRRVKPYLTPQEVADLLMISPVTVRQLALKGDLSAITTPGGHRRFMRHSVEDFARKKGLTLQTGYGNALRILIVDDDVEFSHYLLELLSSLNQKIETEECHDGFDAGMRLFSFQPHIILLDLTMPGMSGFDVCQLVKGNPNTKGMRVIAITGDPSEESTKNILAAGAEACLAKPVELPILLETLGLQDQAVSDAS